MKKRREKKEGNTTRLFASWRGEIFSRSLGRRESRKYLLIISLIGGSTEVGRKDGRGVKEREKGGEVCERLVVRWLAEMGGREREKNGGFLPFTDAGYASQQRKPRAACWEKLLNPGLTTSNVFWRANVFFLFARGETTAVGFVCREN